MSKLTNTLKQMSHWMKNQNNFLEMGEQKITAFRPGLSDREIDNLTHSLPFEIPQELRELYKWHNGDWSQPDCRFTKNTNKEIQDFLYIDPGVMYTQIQSCFREELYFLSLDFIVSNIKYYGRFEDKICLPIFSEENGHYSVLVNNEKYSPVLIDDSAIAFPSVTNLMLAVVDFREQWTAYKIDKSYKELDTLYITLIEEVANKYKGDALLSSASSTLYSIAS